MRYDWNDRKVENLLFGTNDRAWLFWEQVRLAEAQPTTDPLELYFLCVALGFRGEFHDQPEEPRKWVSATRKHLREVRAPELSLPASRAPRTNLPPLRGRQRFLRAVALVFVLLPGLVMTASAVLLHRLAH
jgi:type VI secretion system protein ImpK